MAEQVERDVAERDVLLELGGARDPRAELLREDQRVVAEPERVLRDVGGGRAPVRTPASSADSSICSTVTSPCAIGLRFADAVGHRCGTPSDAV